MVFDPDALPVPDLGLKCRGCGYNLAGLPEHRCPECGRRFTMDEYIPPGDFPILIFDGREVPSTPENVAFLRRMRIPVMEVMRPGESMLGLGGLPHPLARIAVPRECFFEAIDLLRQRKHCQPLPALDAAKDAEWTCPGCGEENPDNFEVCWNCGRQVRGAD